MGFKKKYGHCDVANNYEGFPGLGHWVRYQRQHYREMKQGRYSSMTTDKIQKLNAMDFSWDLVANAEVRVDWVKRYSELRDFKQKNGHCNVPLTHLPNPNLGLWVKTQRNHYKLMREGKPSSMTMKKKQLLEAIGFI